MCSAYIVADKYDEEGNKETHQSGECSGKKKIDNLEAKGAGAAAILNIVVWERKTKDSIWRVLNFELGQTNLSLDPKIEKETFGLKGRSGYFVPSLNILTGTFLSYTSRF